MSYPKDLDEYDDEELMEELDKRAVRRKRGICDYCGQKFEAPSCRFPHRHKAPKTPRDK